MNQPTKRSKPGQLASGEQPERKEPRFGLTEENVDPGSPEAETISFGELTVDLSGKMSDYEAKVRFDMINGHIVPGDIVLHPKRELTLKEIATNRALHAISLGDIPATVEKCLERIAGADWTVSVEWLKAFESERSRAGRHGRKPQIYVEVALRRIESEIKAPGKAIEYMTTRWPIDFVSVSAAHSKVNRAIVKGMLEITPTGPRLTDAAKELLGIASEIDATEDEFEVAISLASEDGDLSQENVDRKIKEIQK